MTIEPDDPDYTLRWPPELLANELGLLVDEALSGNEGDGWEGSVEALLRQAFVGGEPIEEFDRQMMTRSRPRAERYDGEEPF